MKKIKRVMCLVLSLLMLPLANLSVNAEYYIDTNFARYWYNGAPGWTNGVTAKKGYYPNETDYTITRVKSFTNSQDVAVSLPSSSYGIGDNDHEAAKLTFSESNIVVRSYVNYRPSQYMPDLTALMADDYLLRVQFYFDGTAAQAANMNFFLRNDSYAESNRVGFNVFTPMQWSEYYIPIKSLLNADFVGGKMNEFRIETTSDFTGSCDVYIHEIGFVKDLSPHITDVQKVADGLSVQWTDGNVTGASKFNLICNGEVVACVNSGVQTYTHELDVNGIYNYEIQALDSNSVVLDTSAIYTFKSYDNRYSVIDSLFTNVNEKQQSLNWGYQFGTYNNNIHNAAGSFTSEQTIIGGESLKYDMQALNNHNLDLPIYDNLNKNHNVSDIVNTGYIRFSIYVDTEQELTENALRFRLRGTSGSINSYRNFQVEENQWQSVLIKLSDILTATEAENDFNGMEFQCTDVATGKLSLYIQDIVFIDDTSPQITNIQKTDEGLRIQWRGNDFAGLDTFNLICNGSIVDNVDGNVNTYIHELNVNGIYNYEIQALDSNSNVLYTSAIYTFKSYDDDTYVVRDELFTNVNEKQQSLNWSYQFGTYNSNISNAAGSFTSERTIIGGESLKYDMQALNNHNLDLPIYDNLNKNHNVSSILSNGYLRFAIYVDTEQELSDEYALQLRLRDTSGSINSYRNFQVEENQWQSVLIKLSDILTATQAENDFNGIEFKCTDVATGKLSLYIQDIVFVEKIEKQIDDIDQTEYDGTSLFQTFFVNDNSGYVDENEHWVNAKFGTWNNSLSRVVGEFTDERRKFGGVSVKYDLYNSGSPLAAKTLLPIYKTHGSVDISPICRDGYLKMSVYAATSDGLDGVLSVNIISKDGKGAPKSVPLDIRRTNEWVDISVSLAEFDLDPNSAREVYQIIFSYSEQATSALSFYMQNIRFCKPQMFSGLSVFDESGRKVTSIEAGKEYSVEVACLNHTGDDIEPAVIAAAYDGSKIMDLDIVSDIEVLDDGRLLFEISNIVIPQDAQNPVLKVFAWDGLGTMIPYTIYNTAVKDAGDYNQRIYGNFRIPNKVANALATGTVILREYSTSAVVNGDIQKIDSTEKNIYPIVRDSEFKVPMFFILKALGVTVSEISKTQVSANFGNGVSTISKDNSTYGTFIYNGILYADLTKVVNALSYNVNIIGDMAYISGSALDVQSGVNEVISDELSYNWDNINLGAEGYVTGMVIHPNNPNLRYARTDVGGVYKYDTVRGKWVPVLDSIPNKYKNLRCVRGIALDPNNQNVIYLACGSHTYNSDPHDVLKSVDGGKTWRRLGFDGKFDGNNGYIRLSGECIAVDPSNSNKLFVGTSNNGLYVSNNAGESFTKIETIPSKGVTFVLIQGSNIYCGLYGYGVYMSSDSGATFAELNGSPAMPIRAQYANSKLYVSARGDATHNGGLYTYANNTWTDITPDSKQAQGVGAFLVNGNTIFASISPYSEGETPTYRSSNNGSSWTLVKNQYNQTFDRNASCFVQDPNNANAFWAPWGFGISYVVDNGNNTITVTSDHTNIEEMCGTSLLSNPSEYSPMLITQVRDRGMKFSDHEYLLATKSEPSIAIGTGIDFCEGDNSYVVMAGYETNEDDSDTTIAVSTDCGYTFEAVDWDNGPVIDIAVSANDNNGSPTILALTAGDNRGIYRSTNMGSSWNKCSVQVRNTATWEMAYKFLASDRVNGNAFYFLEGRRLYVTKDAGNTWNLVKTFTTNIYNNEFIKTIPNTAGGVWVRHSDGIYASYDYGDTWNLVSGVSDVIAFGFGKGTNDDNVSVYVLGAVDGNIGVYISDNLGSTWRKISNSSTPFVGDINDITGDRKHYGRVYIIESGRGVFYGEPVGSDFYGPAIKLNLSNGKYNGAGVYTDKSSSSSYSLSGSVDKKASVTIDGIPVSVKDDNTFTKSITVNSAKTVTIIATDENGEESEVTLELSR